MTIIPENFLATPGMKEALRAYLGINNLDNTDCLPIGTTVGGFDGTMDENVFAVADGSLIAEDLAPGLKDLLPNVESFENLSTALGFNGYINQIVDVNGTVFIGGAGGELATTTDYGQTFNDLSTALGFTGSINQIVDVNGTDRKSGADGKLVT